MNKNNFNQNFREHVRKHLSPNEGDRNFVSSIYKSVQDVLGESECLQVGSYPRYTAIRPLHDLDIIYTVGDWDEQSHNPAEILKKVIEELEKEYNNPTKYNIEITIQTHSITITFSNGNEEVFSVDIVPAYIFSKNEFNYDTYKVPEILRKKHGRRRKEYYEKLAQEHKEMNWITSDPRGYIEVAKRVNRLNNDFRKTVKFIKAWKNLHKEEDDNFKLKSFHIEQVVTNFFRQNPDLEIFDGIFSFFVEIPRIMERAKIKDRANNNKYIDEYIKELSDEQKDKIIQARDCFLIKLEQLSEENLVEELLKPCSYKRAVESEQFLFDFNIPVFLNNDYSFNIFGEVQERVGSFRKYILDKLGLISIDRKIKFRIRGNPPDVDLFKWKVKNDDSCAQPRGEITDHHTLRDPEETKFNGKHYVECYAILNNVCVAKAKQNVVLNR